MQADLRDRDAVGTARGGASFDAGLIGDKAHSMVFDTAKIRGVVPAYSPSVRFSDGAREIIEWYDADPSRRTADERMNDLVDALISTYRPRPPIR